MGADSCDHRNPYWVCLILRGGEVATLGRAANAAPMAVSERWPMVYLRRSSRGTRQARPRCQCTRRGGRAIDIGVMEYAEDMPVVVCSVERGKLSRRSVCAVDRWYVCTYRLVPGIVGYARQSLKQSHRRQRKILA
jgi:hypothetical protein